MEKNTDNMKTLEKIWLAVVVLTFLSAIPCKLMFPDDSYASILAISFFAEIFITVLYSLLFKITHNKD